jgi:hypothetical protein
VALDTARKLYGDYKSETLGLQVLTIAVLVILITAPIGATAVMMLGPKLLHKSEVKNSTTEMKEIGSKRESSSLQNPMVMLPLACEDERLEVEPMMMVGDERNNT